MSRGPVLVRVANCRSVSARTEQSIEIFKTALTKPGDFGRPDLVLGCEGGDFDAALVAERTRIERHPDVTFAASQFGAGIPRDVAKRGSFIAWREDTVTPRGEARLLVGSRAGEGIMTRYGVNQRHRCRGHDIESTSGHTPPDRAGQRQDEWLDRVPDWPGLIGADFNTRPDELERLYRRQVRGVRGEVLALLVPRHIPAGPARGVDIDSDHLAVDVVLWPESRKGR